jgi:EmrB/QacA subfamily drug resistance transporter
MTIASPLPASAAPLTKRQLYFVFAGVMTGMALAALDGTIVNTALTTIVGDLGGLRTYAWVGTAYLLTSTAVTPLFGKLSDVYGRRSLYQIAIVTFVAGSLLCGIAQTMTQLVLARSLQGVGGGGLMAMSFTIIGDVVPPRERGRYVGFLTGVFTLASVIGPLIGGFIVEHTSWRWIFTINVPLGIVAMLVTTSALRLPWTRHEHRIDFAGAGLLVGGVTALILMLGWSANSYGWLSSMSVGLLALSATLTGAFIARERVAPEPIVPSRLFAVPTVRVVIPMVFVSGAIMFGANAFLPLYLQAVSGVSPTNAGLLLSPLAIGVAVSAMVTGRLTAKTGRYKRWPILGMTLCIIGLLVLSPLRSERGWLAVAIVGMLFVGAGIGAFSPTSTLAVQNAVPWQDLGVASSLVLFFRSLGGVIGLAAYGALLNARIADKIDAELLRRPLAIRALPDEQRTAALAALTDGVTTIFRAAVPLAVIGLILACMLPELPLRSTSAMQQSAVE